MAMKVEFTSKIIQIICEDTKVSKLSFLLQAGLISSSDVFWSVDVLIPLCPFPALKGVLVVMQLV